MQMRIEKHLTVFVVHYHYGLQISAIEKEQLSNPSILEMNIIHCQITLIAKIPIAKCPIAKVPIAKCPIAKIPIAKSPIAKIPIAKCPIAKCPIAKIQRSRLL